MQSLKNNKSGWIKKGVAHIDCISILTGLSIAPSNPLPIFTNIRYNDSYNISLVSTTRIKLKANVKYKLTSNVCTYTTTGITDMITNFYNVTGATYIGNIGRMTPATDINNNAIYSQAEAIFTPTVDSEIELRNTSTGAVFSVIYNGTFVMIEEMESQTISIPKALDMMVGVNQTWQNMISSRVSGTTYFNTTGKPIVVCITGTSSSGNPSVYVNTTIVGSFSTVARTTITFVVQDGSLYRSELNVNLVSWSELR